MASELLRQFDEQVFVHRDAARAIGELAERVGVDAATVARTLTKAARDEGRQLPGAVATAARGTPLGPQSRGKRGGARNR